MYAKQIIRDTYTLCRTVANAFHPDREEYAIRAATLMFMTAAHESDKFIFRRQRGFGKCNFTRGAYGLFQSEWAAILDNLEWLSRHKAVRDRCLLLLPELSTRMLLSRSIQNHGVLFREYKDDENYVSPQRQSILELLQTEDGDTLAAIFCRTHYMRQPGAIPETPEGMAQYAKTHYNTEDGAATPTMYLEAGARFLPTATETNPQGDEDNANQPYVEEVPD